MRILFRALLSTWILGTSLAAQGGPGRVGNGGDSVLCQQTADNPFVGYYSLDYLMTYNSSNQNSDLVEVFDWNESYQRISGMLERNHPDLSYSFEAFVRHLDNQLDYTRERIWQEASFGLVDLKDERMIRRLPKNCQRFSEDGELELIQTVIRQQKPNLVVYEYDPTILKEFRTLAPLQYSFLLIHEWLWDLTQDVKVIRDANRFLHSSTSELLTPEKFGEAIANIGLGFEPLEFVSVCDRSEPVRDRLTNRIGKPCGEITEQELVRNPVSGSRVHQLWFEDCKISSFRPFDFSSIKTLDSLKINNCQVEHIYSEAFRGLSDIRYIQITGNKLTRIPSSLFFENDGNPRKYGTVDFSNNKLQSIPVEVLIHATTAPYIENYRIENLNLRNNAISGWPDTTGKIPRTIYKLDLRDNQFTEISDALCEFAKANPRNIYMRNNPLTPAAAAKAKYCQIVF